MSQTIGHRNIRIKKPNVNEKLRIHNNSSAKRERNPIVDRKTKQNQERKGGGLRSRLKELKNRNNRQLPSISEHGLDNSKSSSSSRKLNNSEMSSSDSSSDATSSDGEQRDNESISDNQLHLFSNPDRLKVIEKRDNQRGEIMPNDYDESDDDDKYSRSSGSYSDEYSTDESTSGSEVSERGASRSKKQQSQLPPFMRDMGPILSKNDEVRLIAKMKAKLQRKKKFSGVEFVVPENASLRQLQEIDWRITYETRAESSIKLYRRLLMFFVVFLELICK